MYKVMLIDDEESLHARSELRRPEARPAQRRRRGRRYEDKARTR